MNLVEFIQKIKSELNTEISILLYEPDPFLSEFLIDILESSKIDYQCISNSQEIIPTLLKGTFNIVILATENLEKDTINLITDLKKIKEDLLIYVMVDYHKNLNIAEIFEAGADEVIFKPFSVGEFKARLWKLLKEYYLNKKVEKFIVEDALTGVYNRRYFEINIREEIYRALRLKYPLCILLIDLDKFKWYNDTFGHKEGDKVLISVGQVLTKNLRANVDKVCRYGGDEFILILPNTTYKEAIKIVHRIFKNWEELPYAPVSLSVGIAQLIEKTKIEEALTDLINRADTAMYKAKKTEGNSFAVDEITLREFSNEALQDRDLSFQSSH